jgi:hypothetical protein
MWTCGSGAVLLFTCIFLTRDTCLPALKIEVQGLLNLQGILVQEILILQGMI